MLGWIQIYPIHHLVYHTYEYHGEGYVAYISIIWGGLYWFIMDIMYPICWVHS